MNWNTRIFDALTRHSRAPRIGSAEDLATRAMVDEWAQHAAAAWQAARADGLSDEAATARVEVLIEQWAAGIDGPPRRIVRADVPEAPATSSTGFAGWWLDVVYALRLLRKQPGFTVVAVLTTALAVGATTTLFSVADGVIGKPLPYPQPDRLARLTETREAATREIKHLITHVTYHRWREAPATIDSIAGFRTSTMNVGAAGSLERLRGLRVTASYFRVLGVSPLRGTFFSEADEAQGAAPVAVITHKLWRDRFGLAEDIIGRSIELDTRSHQIVAVIADGVIFPDPELQYLLPMYVMPVETRPGAGGSISLFSAIIRMQAGTSLTQALEEGTARARTGPPAQMVDMAIWGSQGPRLVTGETLTDSVIGEVRPAILVFLAAVGLLFLTAIANISSLQLARASARRREFAIRSAIGAGSRRLARQLMVESVVLGMCGGGLGVLVALGLHQALPSLLPADFPRVTNIAIDLRVLAFAGAMTMAAGLLCGALPVWQVRRVRLVDALLEDGQAPMGLSTRTAVGRMRMVIMVGQVAIASLLLVGAGVLGRTFSALWSADRGYQPGHMLTARIPMPDHSFNGQRRAEVLATLLDQLRATGGVTAAGFTSVPPISSAEAVMAFSFQRPSDGQQINAEAASRTVSPGYIEALGASLVAGRTFRDTDTMAATPVIVVNEMFVRTYLDGRGVGTMVPVAAHRDRQGSEVVGVIRDIQPQLRGEAPRPEVYFLAAQDPDGVEFSEPSVMVRTAGAPEDLIPTLRRLASEIDGRLALDSVLTMEDRLRAGLARPRLYAVLLTGLSTLALLIAGVGVFGVLSYNVAQRQREIGVRAALGARPVDIVRMTVTQGVWITVAGLAVGLGAAAFLVRFLRDLVWGVAPRDGVSFAVVPVVLLLMAALACYWPARRATRIDPLTALRQ